MISGTFEKVFGHSLRVNFGSIKRVKSGGEDKAFTVFYQWSTEFDTTAGIVV